MVWTEERRKAVSEVHRERLAKLTPEERAARTAAGREKSRQLAIMRRHERWAEEMREAGWYVQPPADIEVHPEPCGG